MKKYATAQTNINQSIRGPITDLVATLLSGWAAYGAGDAKGGVATIDKLAGPEWYPLFKDLHAGMILELSGKEKDAGIRFERAYKLDDSMLRVTEAYARWLSRNKDSAAATTVYQAFDKKLARHPLIVEGLRDTKAGKKMPPLADSAQAGAAEALYGIGATLTRRGGEDLALVYLQLALYLQPTHPLALLSLADLYESVKRPQMAIKVYERVPATSPLKRNAQIQLAIDLDSADRTDEAIKILKGVTIGRFQGSRSHHGARQYRARPQEVRRLRRDLFAGHRRAAGRQRQGQQRLVLLSRHLRGALQAVEQGRSRHEEGARAPARPAACPQLSRLFLDRPGRQSRRRHEDDQARRRAASRRRLHRRLLGWAYYRIGNYEEAVKNLERAIDLKPEDPTINDHLGDAYWRVGRTLEAKFQWAHARDLKPEPEELPKIEAKIANGLTDDNSNSSAAQADKKKDDGKGG